MRRLKKEHLTRLGDTDGRKTYDEEVETRNTHSPDAWRYHMKKLQWRKEGIAAIRKKRDAIAQAVKEAKTIVEKLTILGKFYEIAPVLLPTDYKASDLRLVFPPSRLRIRLQQKAKD